MAVFSIYAQALHYPHPGQVETLQAQAKGSDREPGMKTFTSFLQEIGALSLSEQEELFTHTLDLSPLTAPYVGYQIWGESYKRGEFMAQLSQEMSAPAPLPELVEVLDPAIAAMQKSLKKNEADNPYLLLLKAIGRVSAFFWRFKL